MRENYLVLRSLQVSIILSPIYACVKMKFQNVDLPIIQF